MLPQPALHPLFEALGYTGGYGLYRRHRTHSGDILSDDRRWWIIAAAAIGALLGSRILGLLEYAPVRGFHPQQLFAADVPRRKLPMGGLILTYCIIVRNKPLRDEDDFETDEVDE